MAERINEAVALMREMPGYEDIFEHFTQRYSKRVLSVDESEMIQERRRLQWLDEFKRELDNFNCEDNYE